MESLAAQTLAGLATGSIYATLALAIVVIYKTIHHVNFAQGEMAMFSTFVAWQLIEWGLPYWIAFAATIVLSFGGGVALSRVIFRPLQNASGLAWLAVTVAVLSILYSLAGFLWGFVIKTFPSPFGTKPILGGLISAHGAGMVLVTAAMLAAVFFFFSFTRPGLAMRAAAENPVSARLAGVSAEHAADLGWGLSAAIGAVAGMLVAPLLFLEPNMMVGVMVYAFAAAVLGGLAHPLGAVLGGLFLGVTENLAATFIPVVGRELKLTLALVVIVLVLTVRPSGILGSPTATRV